MVIPLVVSWFIELTYFFYIKNQLQLDECFKILVLNYFTAVFILKTELTLEFVTIK